jgi:integrase
MGKITDVQIRAWLKAGAPVAKSDGDGLTFTLSPKGCASWILRYRLAGRQHEISLGRYPELGLAQARALATEQRAQVQQGVHIAHQKQAAKRKRAADRTVADLARDFRAKTDVGLAVNTLTMRNSYTRLISARLGRYRLSEVTPADVVTFLEHVGREHTTLMAQGAFRLLSGMFDHAVGQHAAISNPCASVKVRAVLGTPAETRQRVMLTRAELAVVLGNLDRLSERDGLAVRILLHTGCRVGELLAARWEHVDFDAEVWSIPVTKTRQAFMQPVTASTLAAFARLRELAFDGEFVMPGNKGKCLSYRAFQGSFGRFVASLECRPFTIHDLRSTCRSYLGEIGVPVHVAERYLNHTLGGVVGIYDRSDYMVERRAAAELWVRYLTEVEGL